MEGFNIDMNIQNFRYGVFNTRPGMRYRSLGLDGLSRGIFSTGNSEWNAESVIAIL